jgi:hypothetical protein
MTVLRDFDRIERRDAKTMDRARAEPYVALDRAGGLQLNIRRLNGETTKGLSIKN